MLQGAIKLFKIRGIEVRLDYSWFIIFALVTYSLSTEYFPSRYDWSPAANWLMGGVTSVLFFVSVLLHELSHSFVAQAYGIPVPRITLFIFGGAAQIAEEPKSASSEFLMALAGPAMSLLIAAVSGGLYYFLGGRLPMLSALVGYIALINVMLAVFNMIPGFPLDGGRVLRAVIWGATRDADKATRIAAFIGRGFAFLFIFGGVYLALNGQIFNGIWIAFIGWFLLQAATQSSKRQTIKDLLGGHFAGEVMWTNCPFIEADTPVADLVYRNIMHTGHRCFPVIDRGRVAGIVTLHNIKAVPPDRWQNTKVGNIMTPAEALKAVSTRTPLTVVMDMMTGQGVNQTPVVQDGRFVGMVTREGLLDFMRTKSELGL
jgi:Zn-dependent protease